MMKGRLMQDEFMDYQALVTRLKENDEIAKKFFAIQTSVLSTLNFDDFFSKLLETIRDKFNVPYVWFSLIHPSKVTTLIHRQAHPGSIRRLSRAALTDVIGSRRKPILMNTNLELVSSTLPEGCSFDFRSIAMMPLTLDGELIGSFNLADPSPERFHDGLDPSFLTQLGLVISICFSNVVAHEELQILAYKDSLTGLLNRRAMERILKAELARAKRYDTPLSLVFVDLDDFKRINDRFGHDRGDDVLIHVASVFTELSRETDIIARYAGDEFVLILPGVSLSETEAVMERLKIVLKDRPLSINGLNVAVRFSYGMACAGEAANADEFLRKADTELYAAKKKKT
jgi:diguanylate cyclase (GGDEF)-like protein